MYYIKYYKLCAY